LIPQQVAAPYVQDEFTGTGTLANRMPDTVSVTGGAWNLGEGTVTVGGSKAVSGNNYVRAVVDAGASEATVSGNVSLVWGGNSAGLVFRATDPNNFLYFRISATGWTLGYVTTTPAGSVGTTIATGKATYSPSATYRLGVASYGNTITLSVNGTAIYSGAAAGPCGTKFGFSSGVASSFTVGDFQVNP
jgi:hypothetical protein